MQTFQFADSTQDIETAVTEGKIAGMLGVAGCVCHKLYLTKHVIDSTVSGHQLGNSLGVLRQYHALGVRYIALVHECHNAFADSCEFNWAFPPHGGLRYDTTVFPHQDSFDCHPFQARFGEAS